MGAQHRRGKETRKSEKESQQGFSAFLPENEEKGTTM